MKDLDKTVDFPKWVYSQKWRGLVVKNKQSTNGNMAIIRKSRAIKNAKARAKK